LGKHRVVCGDATNTEAVQTLLAESAPRLMITDPPYGIELDSEWRDRAGLNGHGPAEPSYMKPIDLMRRPMLNHTKRGGVVYEPFQGSGTTLAAAELTERVCYGMELDPKYVDVVIQRWQTLSGKQATLEATSQTFDELTKKRKAKK